MKLHKDMTDSAGIVSVELRNFFPTIAESFQFIMEDCRNHVSRKLRNFFHRRDL